MWTLTPWKRESGEGRSLTVEPIERHFAQLRNEFDSLMSRMWDDFPGFGKDSPKGNGFLLDLEEDDNCYIAHVVAPGFEISDFDVSVSGNQLVVKAEHKETNGGNGGSSFRYGKVHHMLPLPQGVKAEQVEANYHNGILDLKFPKGEARSCQRIEVKAT